MSETQAHPENEEEYENRRKEIIADAAETKQELESKQESALDAIAQGGDVEQYETVTLGELELEVKAWLPGDVTDSVKEAAELAQELDQTSDDDMDAESLSKMKDSIETMLEALAGLTASDDYDQRFWREYYNRYGPMGVLIAVETVLPPAMEGLEDQREGMDSFHSG